MTVSTSFHGPYTYTPRTYQGGQVEYHDEPYASLRIEDGQGNDVTLYFHDTASARDAAKACIKAAAALEALSPPSPDGES